MKIHTNYILSKLILILILMAGWGGSAWAQSFPVEGKVYTIKAKFADASHDSYITNGGSSLTYVQTAAKEGSYWIAEQTGNGSYPWRFKSVADRSKYLDATNGLGAVNSEYVNFNLISCSNVAGVYHLNGRVSNDTRTNLNIGTWGFSTSRKGFGRSGYGGCLGTGHANGGNPAWTTDYELVECLLLNDNTNIKFVDGNGQTLTQAEVNFTKPNGTVVKISSTDAVYNFGDIACPVSSFSTDIDYTLLSVNFDEGTQTLTFALKQTEWFSIKNERRSDGYLSISNAGLEQDQRMKWGVSSATSIAEYWCMREDGSNGLRIYNKAYGNDYVLGIEGTGNGSRVRMYHVSEANSANTHFDKVASSTSDRFCIMLHSNHGVALHDYGSQLGIWNNGNETAHKNDQGSAFAINTIDQSIIDACDEYNVYKIEIEETGGHTGSPVVYTGAAGTCVGQTKVLNNRYLLVKKEVSTETVKSSIKPQGYKTFEVTYTPATASSAAIMHVRCTSEWYDVNLIQFSSEPGTHDWADDTKWFTINNNRNNQNNQPTRPYLSTSEAFVNDSYQLINNNTPSTIDDRGGVWCFVGDMDGFKIQNAAYGPDFMLGYVNNRFTMVHKDEVGTAQVVFSTTNSSDTRWFDGATHGYAFRIGTSGSNQLHSNNTGFIAWDPGSLRYDDGGSVFKVTAVDDDILAMFEEYDVYKVTTTGSTRVEYQGTRDVFGKRNFSPYFILCKGEPEVGQSNINTSRDIEGFSTDYSQTSTYLKFINVDLALPTILHRQSYLFDKLEEVSDDKLPGQGFIKRGDGMTKNPHTGTDIQYTSNYNITQYVKHGQGKNLYMPTIDGGSCEVTAYQRWYDYQHETMPRTDVIDVQGTYRNQAALYKNGVVVGSNNNRGSVITNAQATLPAAIKEYYLAVDQSRYNDGRTEPSEDLVEPSITMRVIYHLIDAKVMADSLSKCTTTSNRWVEEHTISYPNKKLWDGDNSTKSGVDYIGLNHEFSNYWCYDGVGTDDSHLEQMVDGKLKVELDPASTAKLQNVRILANGHAGIGGVQAFARNRFIGFQYPRSAEGKYEVPENSWAIINVYMQNAAGTKFQLAKIRLTFIGSAEPLLISEVYGKDDNGAFRNNRSMEAMKVAYGNPVAELTFDHAQEVRFECPTAQGNSSTINSEAYAFPLDFKQSSYGYHGAPWASRGEYIFRNGGSGIGGKTFYPVDSYKAGIEAQKTSLTSGDKQTGKYFLYIDASEQPGQVMSIPIPENLCAGTRMFCYGWFNSATQIGQESVGIVLNVLGKKNAADENGEVIYSFNPGLLSTKAFDSDNVLQETVLGAAPWRQVGFSFLIDSETADKYDAYELQVMNNCYSTNGGDFTLDNFYIFANPPKGSVDFTTPLCSDRMRHAKIHADYDMLKNLSSIGVNEEVVDEPEITASYCFVDSVMFDTYVDPELHIAVKDLFERDDKGNHSLKPGLPYTADAIDRAINRAFNVALVGRRCTKNKKDADGVPYEDHGFHSYHIDNDYDLIPVYSYIDSRCEVIYRETTDDGVRRIVFKEDVVRGEMEKLKDENDNNREYYPHMRPSRTYYLVFAPRWVDEKSLGHDDVATSIFGIETSCAYFGTFTTKDPMHVILDNADIESDLPITAVCHGETAYFSFDMPALKVSKPIYDEEYCISDEELDGKLVPESQGLHHYHYEESFNNNDVQGVIKNMPYDWWFGGKLNGTTYRGTIEDYEAAVHPTIRYNHDLTDPNHKHTHPENYKKHGEPVNLALAMENFRFYYPDFKEGEDWTTLVPHDYNNDSGYSLLQSEINTIKDFVDAGIIVLHRNTLDMPMTYEEAEELQTKELSDMMEGEMNDQILDLALKLDDDPAIAALYPLKGLEATVLGMLSDEGKIRLTFEEFSNFTEEQLKEIAGKLKDENKVTDEEYTQMLTMPFSELHRAVEQVLKAMTEEELLAFAPGGFPNIGHEKRAHLVVRALNILSKEVVADLLKTKPDATSEETRAALRSTMISIFAAQQVEVLRKMWKDTSTKLTEDERTELLKDDEHPDTPKNPETMDAAGLAVLVEDGLAKITDNVINDLKSDKYVHFTLVPIMPMQDNFVDEPYIICPEPRGVKLRITSKAPVMLDGFADMEYPEDMTNVPVRLGLKQINETKASAAKTLRIPVRGLKYAIEDGVKAVKLAENTGYYNNLFLMKTNDPAYKQPGTAADTDGLTEAVNTEGLYHHMAGTVEQMVAAYPVKGKDEPDNFLVVKFNDDMTFREGYTYRIGINFMEHDKEDKPTISCYGTMELDLKIVPEYQKWTAAVNNDWTNDANWARADRAELNADNARAGDVISGSTDITIAGEYPANSATQTAGSFVPMYFTNVLLDNAAPAAVLYSGITPANRGEKKFLAGLKSSATDNIVYDMEAAPSTGAWHSKGNYECGLFGTYLANGITFKPGAQLGNAHYLTYNKAWVEYELDADRWYTLGSPLKKSVAGDWYSPTAGGRQQTPHFYDINYSEALNDRFRPAYYQRSWDRPGNSIVYEQSGSTYDSYVKADWSNVYNDAAVDYSAGGFSVKPELAYMAVADRPADGKVLVRLPKADASYKYYDVNGQTGQAADAQIGDRSQSNRLLSDDLKADGTGIISQTVQNATSENNYILLSNPFMAAMDMEAFFDANPSLEKKYWIVDAGRQKVSVKSADGVWVTTDGDGRYVAPLQGFFVKAPGNSVTARYTALMQTVPDAAPVLRAPATRSSANDEGVGVSSIRLTAMRGEASSTALILLSEDASDAYVAEEDCEAFVDGNLYTQPTVYTSAGSVAQTINVRKTLSMVPVGIVSADDSEATLRIDINGDLEKIYLYDIEEDWFTELSDGMELQMNGNNAGRYFITTRIETELAGQADAAVKPGVYTMAGQYMGRTAKGLKPGLYVVDGVKMMVR